VELLAIIVGFVLSIFFSGSETALVAVNRIRLEHWLEKKVKRAEMVQDFILYPQRVLGTTLVGTNIGNVMASSVAAWVLLKRFENYGSVIATLIMTPLLLVLAEILPKAIALQQGDRLILKIIYPLRGFYWILFPIVWFTSSVSHLLLRPAGIRPVRRMGFFTKDHFEVLLDEGKKSGAVDDDESELISEIFSFRDTRVTEVMVPRTQMVAIEKDATIAEAAMTVRESGHSRIPVFEKDLDHIVGMVHNLDLLGVPDDKQTIHDMIRPLPFVPETKTCAELFKELQSRGEHMAIAIDEHSGVAGLVTLEDLLEELVGEIYDEHDLGTSGVQRLGEKIYMLDGLAKLDDVEEEIGVSFPDGEYETVAGLVLARSGRIPGSGEQILCDGMRLTVVSSTRTRVSAVRLEILK
jgi:CBS domain containing-hemolysin-like protein